MTSLPVRVYSYSRCSTCRKALAWLEENQIPFELVDIVENPPSKEELLQAKRQVENRKILFNTSGKSYRNLGALAVNKMSDSEAIDALANDGKLIKRPFLITGEKKVLFGFKKEVWAASLLS